MDLFGFLQRMPETAQFPTLLLGIMVFLSLGAGFSLGGEKSREVKVKTFEDVDLSLFFQLTPPADLWEEKEESRFVSNGYILQIQRSKEAGDLSLSFSLQREDGSPFTIHSYGFHASFPLTEIHRVYPLAPWDNPGLPWEVQHITASSRGIPCLMLLRRDGVNRFTIGFRDQLYECLLKGNLSFRGEGRYIVEGRKLFLEKAEIKTTRYEDALFLSNSSLYWFEVAKRYADFVDSSLAYQPNPIPSWAYEPVYCSWYPYEDNINERIIWENAKIAKEVGIGTFLIDAGWNTKEEGEWWWPNGRYGDYIPCGEKFPDFRGLIRRMQEELGLKVEVWLAPFWLGSESQAYKKGLKEARCKVKEGDEIVENINLCPAHPATKKRLEEVVRYLFEELEVDGLWIDFVDSLPLECHAEHPHAYQTISEGVSACLEAIYRTAISVKPDAVIEYRIMHGNLHNKRFLNVIETTDTPHNYDDNRRFGVYVRSFAKGVVVKTDPTMWSPKCSPQEVAKHLQTMIMGGVPAFSLDLPSLPPSHLQIMSAYLKFYKEHRDSLLKGKFYPLGSNPSFPFLVIEGEKTFIYIGAPSPLRVPLSSQPREIYILNASEGGDVVLHSSLLSGAWQGEIYDEKLQLIDRKTFSLSSVLSAEVPEGGMLKLSR